MTQSRKHDGVPAARCAGVRCQASDIEDADARSSFLPRQADFLGTVYAFGAMLSFTIAHLAVIALRVKQPERERPYRGPGTLRVFGHLGLSLTETHKIVLPKPAVEHEVEYESVLVAFDGHAGAQGVGEARARSASTATTP